MTTNRIDVSDAAIFLQNACGEKEVHNTMLEVLNRHDAFYSNTEVKDTLRDRVLILLRLLTAELKGQDKTDEQAECSDCKLRQ
uniref:Uncharacterized protein n=1 Tax=Ditylenchus dipsaci TaxID=166011 RepID=A0A915DNV5_9BILA